MAQLNANGTSANLPQNVVFEYSVFSMVSYNGLIIMAYLVNAIEQNDEKTMSIGLVVMGIISQYVLFLYGALATWKTVEMMADSLNYTAPFFVLLVMVMLLNTVMGIFLISRWRRS